MLFKQNPFLGGMWAVGNSEIDLSELIVPDKADQQYVNYLLDNTQTIRDFFNVQPAN